MEEAAVMQRAAGLLRSASPVEKDVGGSRRSYRGKQPDICRSLVPDQHEQRRQQGMLTFYLDDWGGARDLLEGRAVEIHARDGGVSAYAIFISSSGRKFRYSTLVATRAHSLPDNGDHRAYGGGSRA